jgi:predicted nucleotidyltransferase
MTTPGSALRQLVEMADSGELDRFCSAHSVELMTAFGSAAHDDHAAADLDLAVALAPGADLYGLIADLVEQLGLNEVDVVDLATADVVLKAEALTNCVPLFESSRGIYARRQMAAVTERMETAYLRRLDLTLLGS